MKKVTAPLSNREIQVWGFILGYFEDNDFSPTRQEIANAVGLNHRQHVQTLLRNIKRKGYPLRFSGKRYRNIIDPAKLK